MWGRRAAIILCVLLSHALILLSLKRFTATDRGAGDEFVSEPITLTLQPLVEPPSADVAASAAPTPPRRSSVSPAVAAPVPPVGESGAITLPRVDWPLEAKKSAARVLAAEAESERIAKMFAGPGGTWQSLTKRQRSKINKFRFKPGVDGLEKDSDGNIIYHLSPGCVVVNSSFVGCAIGKPKVHDDMFDNMRLYFDEQRLPRTDEGNGTEPESRREP